MKIFITLLFLSSLLVGCAGTYNVKGSEAAKQYRPKTAHVVNQGGKSGDMDLHVQRALMAKGLMVSASTSDQKNPAPDLLVRYTDGWQWDIAMYLSAVDIIFYDKNGTMLVNGSYKNTFWHEWPNPGETVQKVVDGMMMQLGPVSSKSSNKP